MAQHLTYSWAPGITESYGDALSPGYLHSRLVVATSGGTLRVDSRELNVCVGGGPMVLFGGGGGGFAAGNFRHGIFRSGFISHEVLSLLWEMSHPHAEPTPLVAGGCCYLLVLCC